MNPHDLLDAIESVTCEDRVRKLAIYVHVPFCTSKCHFCDWVVDIPVSRLRSEQENRTDYVDALCRQIRYYGPLLTTLGYQPQVMYWGGGTPTRLTPTEMRAIATTLADSFDLRPLEQWSMETTPNNLTAEKLDTMLTIGVNRVSVGAQSFNPYQLRRSGRVHTGEHTEQAVELLRAGGIDNFNIDIISSFPGEDLASSQETLERTLALNPPHVSVYPYRATPKTVMAMQLKRSVLAAHSRTHMIEGYELAISLLNAAGYHEYCHGYWVRNTHHEDKDGNYKYDLSGDKIGFGSGAESIIGHHLLWNENTKYQEYLDNPHSFTAAHQFTLDKPERCTALIGGALMTREGLVYTRFQRLTGLSFHDLRNTPYLHEWLQILQQCGARYLETNTSLRIDPTTIHHAYINHLAYTMSAGLKTTRA